MTTPGEGKAPESACPPRPRVVWLRVAFVVGLAGAVGAGAALVNGRSGSAANAPLAPNKGAMGPPAGSGPHDTEAPPARLALVCVPEAAIWERPSASSRVACTVPEGTQLLIAAPDGPWCRVMMAEGPACYVTKEDVRLTGVRISRDVEEPEPRGRPDVVAEAQLHLGTPYVWGGGSRRGADCSGFVQMVFARCGTTLPRAARAQAGVGRAVLATELCPGDRIYFRTGTGPIDHTGIYIGDARFIHASGRRGRVVISRLDDPRYARRYAFARR